MSLLYLHIPYCKRICAYCDFFRSASLATLPAALDAMRSEMERRRDYLGGDPRIRTIYFGGGTPSLCAPQRLQRLIDTASVLWDCSSPEEITVEVNPDDVTDDYVAALRDTAVDRISLGIQSFDDGLLRAMNRRRRAAAPCGLRQSVGRPYIRHRGLRRQRPRRVAAQDDRSGRMSYIGLSSYDRAGYGIRATCSAGADARSGRGGIGERVRAGARYAHGGRV